MGQKWTANRDKKSYCITAGFIISLALTLWVFLSPTVVFADPASPDNLQILDVKCFRHLIEPDDFLAIVLFDIGYDTPPDEPADNYFLFRFIDNNGIDIGQKTPYLFGMNGYNYGITGFYFSATDAPTWGGTHSVSLEGNPTQWSTLPTPSIWALGVSDYSSGATQSANQTELVLWLIGAIQELEQNWNSPGELATATTDGIVLLAAGQYYMLGAIPHLNYMAPDIFIIGDATVNYPDHIDWSDRGDSAVTEYEDTSLESFKELLSTIMGGINSTVASTIVVFIGILLLMALSFARWQQTEYAYMIAPPILFYGSCLTFVPWVIFGICCFAAVAYVAWMKLGKFG